ncbi:MAG: hypothetical protein J6C06_07420 [Lachnospiraceae bacterium]|nr:hypothetical protein [Lachnospiraceae bacterium]
MAKYECKVCGYIYNEQHAGRTFDELTECPICNEGKENFIALDADNNPIEAVKEEVKEAEDFVEEVKAEDNFFEEAKEDAKDEETAADFYGEVKEEVVGETAEEPFSMYKEIKEDADVITAPESEFVVERRQDFWTPVSANVEKKEEPVSNNTTGWTISNAMGSVEKVIGGEEPAEEVKDAVAEEIVEEVKEVAMEDNDMPAFNSRIESFYSSAEPVGTSHIITEEEEEDSFRPLWNSGGGTVQRVIDPFNDKNDSVVKAENIGMVMPAEDPVVEEILGEEEPAETDAVAEEAEVVDILADDEDDDFVVEGLAEETAEMVEETVETESEESDVEDSALFPEDALEEEVLKDETAEVVDYLDEDDDDFFTEMTMDAMMGMEEEHHHGDSSISEEEVFSAIDAIEFDDDVPEGGRIEVVSADGVETIELDDVAEEVAEEAVEELTEEAVETPKENIVVDAVEEDDEPFFFEEAKEEDADEELFANFEETIEENVYEVTTEDMEEMVECVADENADETFEEVEEAVEEISAETDETVEDILEEATTENEEDDEPFFFEEIDEIPTEVTEDDFVTEEEVTQQADTADETVETEDTVETTEEVNADAEEVKEEAPVIKGWSFLDDVVEAGVATGATVAGVNFVTKAMDEVVDEEVTDEDIEEVFVDFAEEVKEEAEEVAEDTAAEETSERLFAMWEAEECKEAEVKETAAECACEAKEEPAYCNNLEKILIVPAQLNPMPLPEGTEVEGRTVLGIASERPLVLDNPVFSTGDYNMVQYIPNSGLTSEDYQKADAIEVIVGHGNGIEKTINSKEDLRQVVNFLRLESDGCPIGIKMGAARIERDLEFCVFAKPDYVVLNNFDVVPLAYALHRATKYLNAVQSDMDIVIALDGAKDAEELAKIMAMGADVIALRNRPEKMDEMVEGLKNYARITGHYDVEDLNVKDLCTVDREIAEFTDIYHV